MADKRSHSSGGGGGETTSEADGDSQASRAAAMNTRGGPLAADGPAASASQPTREHAPVPVPAGKTGRIRHATAAQHSQTQPPRAAPHTRPHAALTITRHATQLNAAQRAHVRHALTTASRSSAALQPRGTGTGTAGHFGSAAAADLSPPLAAALLPLIQRLEDGMRAELRSSIQQMEERTSVNAQRLEDLRAELRTSVQRMRAELRASVQLLEDGNRVSAQRLEDLRAEVRHLENERRLIAQRLDEAVARVSLRVLLGGGAAAVVVRRIGTAGSGPGQLHGPVGLYAVIDPHDPKQRVRELLVADCSNHRVHALDPADGHLLYAFDPKGADDVPPSQPFGVCVTAAGELLVMERENHRISAFFRNPNWPAAADTPLSASPAALLTAVLTRDVGALAADYVAPGTVQFAYTLGSEGDEPGQFSEPYGMCLSRDEVFVCDDSNDRVQVFVLSPLGSNSRSSRRSSSNSGPGSSSNSNGNSSVISSSGQLVRALQFRHQWGTRGSGMGQFRGPTCVAVAHAADADDDEVVISDWKNHRVQVFTRDGRFLRAFGSEGAGDGELSYPIGVLVNGDAVLVGDTGNHRVSVFERTTGHWLRHLQLPAGAGLRGLALCAATATLFVADAALGCVHVLQ